MVKINIKNLSSHDIGKKVTLFRKSETQQQVIEGVIHQNYKGEFGVKHNDTNALYIVQGWEEDKGWIELFEIKDKNESI